ncbi:hypothetical protein F4677DRAFT_167254 [Hypoxylon crocopeplum]|nr:hypothetical protein F4677DRAFT_167254 [Hypoxylon crocopeplum]
MADARALLRAHRAENRIKHPHAAYSDAGKLLCKLCHEAVKSEALWEGHVRTPSHKKKLQALQSSQQTGNGNGANKRKHDDVDDTMSDIDEDGTDDAVRKKRNKTEMVPTSQGSEKRQTPPVLGRRTSNTPAQGVEIAIPSRPATPAAGSTSATSTPKAAPVGRSPLMGSDANNTPPNTSVPSAQATSFPISTQPLAAKSSTMPTTNNTQPATTSVDEAEWAAFEAEMAVAAANEDPASASASYSADATISAPAMTAEQLAAKSQEEESERRKHLWDAQMADEREDATRALEAEFEEMEELEGRVRRLKERREELRKGSVANLRATAAEEDVVMAKAPPVPEAADGKENRIADVNEEDDDEDDDEEDEDDGWDAFRFR